MGPNLFWPIRGCARETPTQDVGWRARMHPRCIAPKHVHTGDVSVTRREQMVCVHYWAEMTDRWMHGWMGLEPFLFLGCVSSRGVHGLGRNACLRSRSQSTRIQLGPNPSAEHGFGRGNHALDWNFSVKANEGGNLVPLFRETSGRCIHQMRGYRTPTWPG